MTATKTVAERNRLVLNVIPLAEVIVGDYCVERGLIGMRDEVRSDAYAALLSLAETFDPGRATWAKYVSANLRYRLLDSYRARFGRAAGAHADRRQAIGKPVAIDLLGDVFGGEDLALEWLDISERLAAFVKCLSARDRQIVAMRLGGAQLQEIGDLLGVGGSRVSQLLARIRVVFDREVVTHS